MIVVQRARTHTGECPMVGTTKARKQANKEINYNDKTTNYTMMVASLEEKNELKEIVECHCSW